MVFMRGLGKYSNNIYVALSNLLDLKLLNFVPRKVWHLFLRSVCQGERGNIDYPHN